MICATIALAIGLYTTHFDTSNLNNDNHALGIQCNNYTYLNFTNSFDTRSDFIGYDFNMREKDLSMGLLVGAVTGYPKVALPSNPSPIMFPYVQLGPVRVGGFPGELMTVSLILEWKNDR